MSSSNAVAAPSGMFTSSLHPEMEGNHVNEQVQEGTEFAALTCTQRHSQAIPQIQYLDVKEKVTSSKEKNSGQPENISTISTISNISKNSNYTAVASSANASPNENMMSAYNENTAIESKWSRNGYGQPCPLPPRGGKFTAEETAIVRAAIQEYCAAKNISVSRLCSECDHKSGFKGAWMEISKKLPHRTVQSVYRHGLRQLHPFQRGPWTEGECELLTEAVKEHGKKWSTIQNKLNRSADSCRDKYREMSTDYIKGRWKQEECELLKRLIKEFLNVDANTDLRDVGRIVEQQNITIPWSLISKKMAKRSRLSCFKKWQKMTQTPGNSGTKRTTSKSTVSSQLNTLSTNLNSGPVTEQHQSTESQENAQPVPEGTVNIKGTAFSVSTTAIPTTNNANSVTAIMNGVSTIYSRMNQLDSLRGDGHLKNTMRSKAFTPLEPNLSLAVDKVEDGLNLKADDLSLEEDDLYLLQQISEINTAPRVENHTTLNSIIWSDLRHPYGAFERFKTLVQEMDEEYQQERYDVRDGSNIFSNPLELHSTSLHPNFKPSIIVEMAKLLLERKKTKKAAVVVEAVNIPIVESLSPKICTSPRKKEVESNEKNDNKESFNDRTRDYSSILKEPMEAA